MNRSMDGEEWREFVMQGHRTGKLATVRADGRPHVVPIWFVLSDEGLLFMTGEDTVKAHNIRNDNRVSLCVDDEDFPFSFVLIEGEARVLHPTSEQFQQIATKIARRYVGDERAAEYGQRNAVPGELLVLLVPTGIVTGKNVAL